MKNAPPRLRFYKLRGPQHRRRRYIPIEFSAAAGRFGHSMVRPAYRLNRKPGIGQPFAILSRRVRKPKTDLRGFEHFLKDWAIQWDLFFAELSPAKKQKSHTMNRVQPAYKIDTSLTAALGNMPFAFKEDMPSLPARNLLRGSNLGLPSGQAVARALHEKPLTDQHLRVYVHRGRGRRAKHIPVTEISASFRGKAPLWFYILAEAQHEFSGMKLGCVGGRIVMETFVGLMLADRHCFLNQNPGWKPDLARRGKFGMAELVHEALSWRPPPGND